MTLYADLMALVETNEAFYFVNQILDDKIYRVFSYRLASYTDFLQPGAVECRGIMFEVDGEGRDAKPLRLAALPMEKFWNLNENPFTMNLDLSDIRLVMLKADGSLISSYLHNNDLRLKSKTSLTSDQAYAAMDWLNLPENLALKNEIYRAEKLGNTVNMEWCAPDNRIVIGYEKPSLTILNVRNRETGEYVNYEDVDTDIFPNALNHWIEFVGIKQYGSGTYATMEDFIADVPNMTGIEGFVVRLGTGQFVKIKTSWYLALHHTKDSINSPRRLYEAVLEEATDDMRSLFHDDPVAIRMIEEMEQKVEILYNHLVDSVERFYERNKHMTRKDYAILGQQELDRKAFGLAMSKYIGQNVDYKDFMKRNWKNFGIKDKEVTEE